MRTNICYKPWISIDIQAISRIFQDKMVSHQMIRLQRLNANRGFSLLALELFLTLLRCGYPRLACPLPFLPSLSNSKGRDSHGWTQKDKLSLGKKCLIFQNINLRVSIYVGITKVRMVLVWYVLVCITMCWYVLGYGTQTRMHNFMLIASYIIYTVCRYMIYADIPLIL